MRDWAPFQRPMSHLVSSEDRAGNLGDAQISWHLRTNCRSQGTGALWRRCCEVFVHLEEHDAARKKAGKACSAFKLADAAREAPWHLVAPPRRHGWSRGSRGQQAAKREPYLTPPQRRQAPARLRAPPAATCMFSPFFRQRAHLIVGRHAFTTIQCHQLLHGKTGY